jgi:hypothetical protein
MVPAAVDQQSVRSLALRKADSAVATARSTESQIGVPRADEMSTDLACHA